MRITFFLLFFFSACQFKETAKPKTNEHIIGKTMGTTYSIKYGLEYGVKITKAEIDSILVSINDAVSTYEPASIISTFNQHAGDFSLPLRKFPAEHFLKNYQISRQIYEETAGNFDPTVMPLVNYWGFGYTEKKPVLKADSMKIEATMQSVGLNKLETKTTNQEIIFLKKDENLALDFSAIAKGYAVDFLAETMASRQVKNFMIEIGGEVRTRGINDKGSAWKIGINKPQADAALNSLEWVVALENVSMASSGNYRNFYEVHGQTYGHEINPLSGYPESTDLLGVSVIHRECIYADAYATAFMVMGLEKSLKHAEKNGEIEVCFISAEDGKLKSTFTSGFESYLVE